MSTYYISMTDNLDGTYTPTVIRGGTAPSGGTSVTIVNQENYDGSYSSNKTKLFADGAYRAVRAADADRASGN